jgi:hypothetical protein
LGLTIWYDEFSLTVGDSLHESIERGLSGSRFGIVVFSPAFFSKRWTRAELNGLFSKQILGQKVILPIWHNVSATDVLEEYPILADIVAIKSDGPLTEIARALVKVIRPELLRTSESAAAAAFASERLAIAVESDFPGYSIQVTTGASAPVPTAAADPTLLASLFRNGVRTDIHVKDPELLRGREPRIGLSFRESGVDKMLDAIKTGRAQEFLANEFAVLGGNFPLMPSIDELSDGTLQLKPRLNSAKPLEVRLELTHPNKNIQLPILYLQGTRAGTEEFELTVSHPQYPFTLAFVMSTAFLPEGQVDIHTAFSGFNFGKLAESIEILDLIADGAEIEIFQIFDGKRLVKLKANIKRDWIPEGIVQLVQEVAAIERFFGLSILWPSRITDEDVSRIHFVHSMITGEEIGTNLRLTSTSIIDAEVRKQLTTLTTGPVFLLIEPTDQSRVSPIFGVTIPVPRWGLQTAEVVAEDPGTLISELSKARDDDRIEIALRGQSSTYAVMLK